MRIFFCSVLHLIECYWVYMKNMDFVFVVVCVLWWFLDVVLVVMDVLGALFLVVGFNVKLYIILKRVVYC